MDMARRKNNKEIILHCVFRPVTRILAPTSYGYQVRTLIAKGVLDEYANELREFLLKIARDEEERKKIDKHVEKYKETFVHLDAIFHRVYNEKAKGCKFRAAIPKRHLISALKRALRIMYYFKQEEVVRFMKLGVFPDKVEGGLNPEIEERITNLTSKMKILDLRSLRRDVITIEPLPFVSTVPLLNPAEIFPSKTGKSWTYEYLEPGIHEGEFIMYLNNMNEQEYKDILTAIALAGRIGLYKKTKQGYGQFSIEVRQIDEKELSELLSKF